MIRELSLPKGVWFARAFTVTTGLGLQLMGLYAIVVTFGAWTTLGLGVAGALAVVLQHAVLRRTSC